MARQELSRVMRVADMVQISTSEISDNRVMLPSDWQGADFVRVIGGPILEYRTRNAFYSLDDDVDDKYTISGLFLQISGPEIPEGRDVELHYFADLPVLGDISNWVTLRFLDVYLSATLKYAYSQMKDTENAVLSETNLSRRIPELNDAYIAARTSGSVLKVGKRSGFG